MFDDPSRARGGFIIGSRPEPPRSDVVALAPWTFRRIRLGFQRQIRKHRDVIRCRARIRAAEIKHVPLAAMLERRAVCRGGGIRASRFPEIQNRAKPLPCDKVAAGGEAGEPPLRTRSVVSHVVKPPVLKHPCFPCAEDIAVFWTMTIRENQPLILCLQAPAAGRSAVGIVNGLGGSYPCHEKRKTSAPTCAKSGGKRWATCHGCAGIRARRNWNR